MKIREIRCAGLRGATPEGGWSNELRPDDCVHTLIAVHTDEGAVGLGSVFTNDALVRARWPCWSRFIAARTPSNPSA
jgi:D-galactarolactone cycloisomerase